MPALQRLHSAESSGEGERGDLGPLCRLHSDACPRLSYWPRRRAHAAAGSATNFLDASFLADGRTTLRAHLHAELESAGKGSGLEEGGTGWSRGELAELSSLVSCW